MKKQFLTMLFLVALHACFSQNSLHRKAAHNLSQFEYSAAANTYKEILKKNNGDTLAMEKLAVCYYKLNNAQQAEPWLAKICNGPNTKPSVIKMYAEILAINAKYNDATTWYHKYLRTDPSDYSVAKILEGFSNLHSWYKDSSFYSIKPLAVNSDQSDFSPTFYQEGILFCSARNSKKGKADYAWNNSFYIDLYVAKDVNASAINFGKPVNSALHEGPATFSANEDTIYFTRNNYIEQKKESSSDGITKLKIYYSAFENGVWQKVQNIGFNNNEYSNGHPALSPDHKLYFTSDMPGGFGKADLYYTKLLGGKWIAPVNLGKEINTSGNEMFPYIDAHGNLYFASNGLPSLGGLDIFIAEVECGVFKAPKNMGYPVNTSADDFGIIIKNNKGFFSSNRGNDSNNDNLYELMIEKTRSIIIKAADKDGKPIEAFNIQIVTNIAPSTHQQVDSVFNVKLNCEENYFITCSKVGYLKRQLKLEREDLIKLRNDQVVTLVLEKASIKVNIHLQSEGKPLTQGEVQIKNTQLGEISIYKIDDKGILNIELNPAANYELVCSKPNYKPRTVNINGTDIEKMKDGDRVDIELPLTTSLFDKIEIGQIIELDIKYDVNKFNIRKDAAKELDKLVFFLKKNETAKIEMGSHTDSRGSADANLSLSQKRAGSAAQYIVSKGISSRRIIPIGYGKGDLKVKDAVSEEDHQQNRRTTVKIIGI